jgi:hypothetical protein
LRLRPGASPARAFCEFTWQRSWSCWRLYWLKCVGKRRAGHWDGGFLVTPRPNSHAVVVQPGKMGVRQ